MLLFIITTHFLLSPSIRFQYISCYCLSGRKENKSTNSKISIHLMLLFIGHNSQIKRFFLLFQYISCYCLSITSSSRFTIFVSFQYISCYCLSRGIRQPVSVFQISIHLMLLFIPQQHRYCLSSSTISIHLMLLFITSLLLFQGYKRNFNTSHVTVYRSWIKNRHRRSEISIHLMLQQYISFVFSTGIYTFRPFLRKHNELSFLVNSPIDIIYLVLPILSPPNLIHNSTRNRHIFYKNFYLYILAVSPHSTAL